MIASDPETRRALELDTLAAILPMDRRDRLAELLTDDDVATLTHLARAGMGANTLRALASDLAYLETWAWAVLSGPLPWPAPEALILRFVAHHLWDPVQRETDPSHGMPEAVASILRANDQLRVEGPHAPATVRRRLAHWSTLHRWRGLTGPVWGAQRPPGPAPGHAGRPAPAGAQERAPGDARRAGSAARHL